MKIEAITGRRNISKCDVRLPYWLTGIKGQFENNYKMGMLRKQCTVNCMVAYYNSIVWDKACSSALIDSLHQRHRNYCQVCRCSTDFKPSISGQTSTGTE